MHCLECKRDLKDRDDGQQMPLCPECFLAKLDAERLVEARIITMLIQMGALTAKDVMRLSLEKEVTGVEPTLSHRRCCELLQIDYSAGMDLAAEIRKDKS